MRLSVRPASLPPLEDRPTRRVGKLQAQNEHLARRTLPLGQGSSGGSGGIRLQQCRCRRNDWNPVGRQVEE